MKKLLIGIFTFLIGFISFSSAEKFTFTANVIGSLTYTANPSSFVLSVPDGISYSVTGLLLQSCWDTFPDDYVTSVLSGFNDNNFTYLQYESLQSNRVIGYLISFDSIIIDSSHPLVVPYNFYNSCSVRAPRFVQDYYFYNYYFVYNNSQTNQSPFYGVFMSLNNTSSSSDITVFYDYGHTSTSVACNGDNSIYIDGMATVSNQTTFTPFFNISYVDQDNQNLIESYNKDILYLQNGQFKKTFTGDNQWILTVQNQGGFTPDIIFTGETLPVVVTGDSDNVFSNFGDNALSVLYGNIPGFITGAVILFLIFFLIRLFIPKNRR